ncbi:MAG: hypothetical protein ABF306_02205 [Nocardioides marinisabuli]|uniref:hypothetical protein n=1 Tax=Nocardioides marinisabuli TaxID=419476 RepID=UPI00321AAD01
MRVETVTQWVEEVVGWVVGEVAFAAYDARRGITDRCNKPGLLTPVLTERLILHERGLATLADLLVDHVVSSR